MSLIVSALICGYLYIGIGTVYSMLKAEGLDVSLFTIKPKVSMALAFALLWPLHYFFNDSRNKDIFGRVISILLSLILSSCIFWGILWFLSLFIKDILFVAIFGVTFQLFSLLNLLWKVNNISKAD
jgi:hypothetical protein